MHTEVQAAVRPAITLSDDEADALADLAFRSMATSSLGAKLLQEEVDRANTVPASKLPSDIVTMNSRVVFEDETTGETHSVQLVFPKDADMEAHRLSVLSPMGAGLIGMKQGGTIEWPNRQGTLHRVTIIEVVQPPRD
jgi:regulator of nucleoside diphosphate kinase